MSDDLMIAYQLGLHDMLEKLRERADEIERLRERLAEADEANRRVSDENEKLREALAAERERCAKIAERYFSVQGNYAMHIADEIRESGDD